MLKMVHNFAIILVILTFTRLCLNEVRGRLFSKQQPRISIKDKQQIYDCIDFYNQPAFNNPLLRNISSKVTSKMLANEGTTRKEIGLKNGGCPYGTVPILRITGNSHKRVQSEKGDHCGATVFTVQNGRQFLGANGGLSLHKPIVPKAGQWSAARVALTNGPEFIQAGWMVFPDLFKDNEPHLFIRFKGQQGGECINTECPGFVQVSKDLPLGYRPTQFGHIGGEQYSWNMTIEKHEDDGNWWVAIIGKDKYNVGYWPKSLFSGLANFATEANWGGEIDNPGANYPGPDMGNGLRPAYDTSRAAFVMHITVLDQSYRTVNPDNTRKYWNCEADFSVQDFGYKGDYWGHTLVYGGPR